VSCWALNNSARNGGSSVPGSGRDGRCQVSQACQRGENICMYLD
jgi:hypothetical protein